MWQPISIPVHRKLAMRNSKPPSAILTSHPPTPRTLSKTRRPAIPSRRMNASGNTLDALLLTSRCLIAPIHMPELPAPNHLRVNSLVSRMPASYRLHRPCSRAFPLCQPISSNSLICSRRNKKSSWPNSNNNWPRLRVFFRAPPRKPKHRRRVLPLQPTAIPT